MIELPSLVGTSFDHIRAEVYLPLDLIYVQPQAPKATVRARAITTPKHMKRLLLALQDNLSKHEARFGPIDLGEAIQFPGVIN